MQYSDIVMDHFMKPRNVGDLENPDGIGEIGNISCGDIMRMVIKVQDGHIEDVKFKTFGCGAAIAVSSIVTEMAKGKSLEEAASINRDDVAKALGGLPSKKLHCSNLGTDALKAAINDYWVKQGHPERIIPLEDEHEEIKDEDSYGSDERRCRQLDDGSVIDGKGI